jgi:hypothetical protein
VRGKVSVYTRRLASFWALVSVPYFCFFCVECIKRTSWYVLIVRWRSGLWHFSLGWVDRVMSLQRVLGLGYSPDVGTNSSITIIQLYFLQGLSLTQPTFFINMKESSVQSLDEPVFHSDVTSRIPCSIVRSYYTIQAQSHHIKTPLL